MAEPPGLAGAVNATEADAFPGVIAVIAGTPGADAKEDVITCGGVFSETATNLPLPKQTDCQVEVPEVHRVQFIPSYEYAIVLVVLPPPATQRTPFQAMAEH